jgi:hypothetical protein
VAEAKAALFARLPEDARGAYWDALSRFVRFEITKSEFARACACLDTRRRNDGESICMIVLPRLFALDRLRCRAR